MLIAASPLETIFVVIHSTFGRLAMQQPLAAPQFPRRFRSKNQASRLFALLAPEYQVNPSAPDAYLPSAPQGPFPFRRRASAIEADPRRTGFQPRYGAPAHAERRCAALRARCDRSRLE